jgi:hypothetical protein
MSSVGIYADIDLTGAIGLQPEVGTEQPYGSLCHKVGHPILGLLWDCVSK